MSDADREPPVRALQELGAEFDRVARAARAPSRRAWWRRGRPALALAAGAVVALVVVALAVGLPPGGGGGGAALASVRLPDGEVVEIERAFDRAQLEDLARDLARYDVELQIDEVPVEPRADGRVYDVSFPQGARFDDEHRLVVGEGGLPEPIVVTLGTGSADRRGTTAGLTLFEALPAVCRAIDYDDPRATARALRRLGFSVRWVFVDDAPDPGAESPTVGGEVPAPPPGTAVLSVLGPGGEWTDVPRDTRRLMVEVSPRGSEILAGHEGRAPCP